MRPIKPFILLAFLSLEVTCLCGQSHPVSAPSKDTLPLKVDTLKAAIVTAKMRPRMKGDTVEYNTENFRLRVNANVEELLSQLPGLHIDLDGTITYNGQKIQLLLVDGEDIFGADPTLVTRNFDGSKIARVQVLERKSDQAIFTGIDDGIRTRTLNLILKEDEKNGYFGKVEAAGGLSSFHIADGLLALFQGKEQFTGLGLSTNTGLLALTNNPSAANASIFLLSSNSDALGASAGRGIPNIKAAALHYANTWNGQENHLTGNYQYVHVVTYPVCSTITQQFEAFTSYLQDQKSQSINQQDQHWGHVQFEWAPGKNSAFRFSFHGISTLGQNQFGATQYSQFNDTLVNSSVRNINDRVNNQNSGGEISWRTTVGHRTERVLSLSANFTELNNVTNGYLYAVTKYFQNGSPEMADTTDQRKYLSDHSITLNSSINYSEPLWKSTFLGFSYGLKFTGDAPSQETFSRGDGKYQEIVDSLTNNYNVRVVAQNVLISIRGNLKNGNYTFGNNWVDYTYKQQNMTTDSVSHQHYLSWAPMAMFFISPNPATSFDFNYNASTQQPSIAQLQPVKNNNDPLHLTLGNPNLKPGFNQNFDLEFHRMKTWIIGITANLTLTKNAISTLISTDTTGRQISQPVNVNGNRSAGLNCSIERNFLGIDFGFHTYTTYTHAINYVNSELSQNNTYNIGSGFSMRKYVPDKFEFQLNTNFTWSDSYLNINAGSALHYWTQNHSASISLFIIPGFEFNTNAGYNWQAKTSAFSANTSTLLWNANISRNLLKNRLVIKAMFNNLLDQNAGITRTNTLNTYTQTSTNILGRYWMLSASWHFDRKFKHK